MLTDVNLANMALIPLEDGPISSLEEENEAARLCKAAMPGAIETVLAEHDWNCATRLSTLGATLADPPAHGYAYAYQLPNDCLKVQRLGQVGDDIKWRKVGRQVHTNVTPGPDLTYTARIEPKDMDPPCANAVAARLAAMIARKLTGSTTQQNQSLGLAEQIAAVGGSLDAGEGNFERAEDYDHTSWADDMD